jgi:hypothetical protein
MTIGYHIVFSAYGLWLPGDERTHWSDAWDEQIGFYEPHMLHPGDPIRKRMAQERMAHPRVVLDVRMVNAITEAIDECQRQSDWMVKAAAIEATHTHLLLSYTKRDRQDGKVAQGSNLQGRTSNMRILRPGMVQRQMASLLV